MRSRVHPTYKTKYRVTNWQEYGRSLVRRGDAERYRVVYESFELGGESYESIAVRLRVRVRSDHVGRRSVWPASCGARRSARRIGFRGLASGS